MLWFLLPHSTPEVLSCKGSLTLYCGPLPLLQLFASQLWMFTCVILLNCCLFLQLLAPAALHVCLLHPQDYTQCQMSFTPAYMPNTITPF